MAYASISRFIVLFIVFSEIVFVKLDCWLIITYLSKINIKFDKYLPIPIFADERNLHFLNRLFVDKFDQGFAKVKSKKRRNLEGSVRFQNYWFKIEFYLVWCSVSV